MTHTATADVVDYYLTTTRRVAFEIKDAAVIPDVPKGLLNRQPASCICESMGLIKHGGRLNASLWANSI